MQQSGDGLKQYNQSILTLQMTLKWWVSTNIVSQITQHNQALILSHRDIHTQPLIGFVHTQTQRHTKID